MSLLSEAKAAGRAQALRREADKVEAEAVRDRQFQKDYARQLQNFKDYWITGGRLKEEIAKAISQGFNYIHQPEFAEAWVGRPFREALESVPGIRVEYVMGRNWERGHYEIRWD